MFFPHHPKPCYHAKHPSSLKTNFTYFVGREIRARKGKVFATEGQGFLVRRIVPPQVDRRWLWVCYNKIPLYLIFYLLKGDYMSGLCLGLLAHGLRLCLLFPEVIAVKSRCFKDLNRKPYTWDHAFSEA